MKALFKLANYMSEATKPSTGLRWQQAQRKCYFNLLHPVLRFGILMVDGVAVDSPPTCDVVAYRIFHRFFHSGIAVPVTKKAIGDVRGLNVSQGAASVLSARLFGLFDSLINIKFALRCLYPSQDSVSCARGWTSIGIDKFFRVFPTH